MIAMQCMFCVFWQDSDINCSDAMRVFLWPDNDINCSDAVRALFILAGHRYQFAPPVRSSIDIVRVKNYISYLRCNACFLWPDNDINYSNAVRVLCILAGQRYQL